MPKAALAAGLLALAAGAWYWALLPAAAPARAASRVATASRDVPEVPQVRLERLRDTAVVRPTGDQRDPFRRAAQVHATTGGRAAPVTTPTTASEMPAGAAPAWPRLELIGIAEGRVDGAVVRIAIVSGPLGVLHARPGETVERVYRLERVAADAVELRLLPEDRLVRLALRP